MVLGAQPVRPSQAEMRYSPPCPTEGAPTPTPGTSAMTIRSSGRDGCPAALIGPAELQRAPRPQLLRKQPPRAQGSRPARWPVLTAPSQGPGLHQPWGTVASAGAATLQAQALGHKAASKDRALLKRLPAPAWGKACSLCRDSNLLPHPTRHRPYARLMVALWNPDAGKGTLLGPLIWVAREGFMRK